MPNAIQDYRVVFPPWYDERGEWEAESKGWLQGVEVHLANGVHSLFLYDPVRLSQDLEMEAKLGKPFIAQPNLVVIPDITRQAILDVVPQLIEVGFFDRPGSQSMAGPFNGHPAVSSNMAGAAG